MKVRVAEQDEFPHIQFVVEAENEHDELILRIFNSALGNIKNKLEFCQYGCVKSDGKYTSFNFGTKKKDK